MTIFNSKNVSSGHYASSFFSNEFIHFSWARVSVHNPKKIVTRKNDDNHFFVDFNIFNGILVLKWILVTEILSWDTLVSL